MEKEQQELQDNVVHLLRNGKKSGSHKSEENNDDEWIDHLDQTRAQHRTKREEIFHEACSVGGRIAVVKNANAGVAALTATSRRRSVDNHHC